MANFYDKLKRNIAMGANELEPLFGGLIPRREIIQEPIVESNPVGGIPDTPIRQTGLQKVNNDLLGGKSQRNVNPFETRDVKFDWTEQELGLKKKALDLEREKLGLSRETEGRELGLKEREQTRKEISDKNQLGVDKSKQDIDERKQALDEWKSKNPDGQIETTKDGKIFIIDKRTGKSIDTGLISEHLTEEKKLELQAKNAQELESLRQKNRLALEGAKIKTPRVINPTQIRVAEDDAAAELLNDPRYSWLSKEGIIRFDKDRGVIINHPSKGYYGKTLQDAQGTVKSFQDELKKKAEERSNRVITNGRQSVDDANLEDEDDMVEIIHPKTGAVTKIPRSEVEQARRDGAIISGESQRVILPNIPSDAVDDNIELFYGANGKVIGARNKKNPRISKFEE